MPIYEYQCSKCKKVQEIWQKISEAALTRCPICKGKMERLISSTGFSLKGSGWYATDYTRKGKSESKTESKTGESKPESGEKSDKPPKKESKKDSKKDDPAAKAA